jgi:hypothetical protein
MNSDLLAPHQSAVREVLWVDTSVQVDKLFGPDKVQRRIRARLEGADARVAPYVKMEFIRGQLPTVAFLIDLLQRVQQEGGDLSEVLRRLSRGAHGREVSKRISILGYALHRDDLQLTEQRLRVFLKSGWEDIFTEDVNLVMSDPLDCQWVSPAIRTSPPLGPPAIHCNYQTQCCRADQFVTAHQGSLQRVAQATSVKAATKEAAERALADPQKARGQNTCWPLGDTFIVLQAPQGSTVYTTDREMEAICNVLGVKCFREPTEV